jgi:homopolymeric O-antigen transport system ATP-binding protein
MRPIIKVEGISKRFRIQPREARSAHYETLRESLVRALRSPFVRRRPNGARDDTIWALKDASFEVMPGEVMGIIGPNGAGKSTLLKVLSRIIEPTSGRVELYGRVASLLEVGTGFHPDLSGRENVYLNGAILGMKRREIDLRFDEMVAFAEVEKFIDTAVKHYSSGMYLRLAFAVAAHLDPEVLIVDEVLAVGDANFQKKCLGKMDDVTLSGRTVLLVTHSLAIVTQHCQRAVLINEGRIKSLGPAEEVVANYEAMCLSTRNVQTL